MDTLRARRAEGEKSNGSNGGNECVCVCTSLDEYGGHHTKMPFINVNKMASTEEMP